MAERVYTDYPALYDAIQSGRDYDRDASFVLDALARLGFDVETADGFGPDDPRTVFVAVD